MAVARDPGNTRLSAELLLQAYAVGIFPMAESRDDPTLYWIDPEMRGVLPIEGFHLPRSLRKRLRRGDFDVQVDTAFSEVLVGCAEATEERPNSWINAEIARLYEDLFSLGHAHSVETWRDGRLVGGLYGVALGGAFFGESMFSREPDASKLALVHLVARLWVGGFMLLDTQFVTAHLERFGAVEIPRKQYRTKLAAALGADAHFYPELDESDFSAFLQSRTRTS